MYILRTTYIHTTYRISTDAIGSLFIPHVFLIDPDPDQKAGPHPINMCIEYILWTMYELWTTDYEQKNAQSPKPIPLLRLRVKALAFREENPVSNMNSNQFNYVDHNGITWKEWTSGGVAASPDLLLNVLSLQTELIVIVCIATGHKKEERFSLGIRVGLGLGTS
jgi:hypothetical protein